MVRTEEGADLEGVIPSEVDRRLVQVYGDHINQNDGCHMDRGITYNEFWQVQWRLRVIQAGLRYRAPKGAVSW